ncbi:aminotransferase class V-fold PLP-dependent enzyme [Lentzea sp. BCCO 10_0856]|uniref:Aminotransferase class V-fold PLP-dependent enzyme n=1 Tax=Lentzea miocenica TaxID=3095431 RepID=A0ABU4TB01_9PSEU|nr:aminotransferase class V-fold PLP-dependent enzyme [Lentzea sp. BCCO 10_0856]MDX8035275.1 aminotransferase class V-fold PLP-dependent enzyme [Lentzea sp. BCCO 10_0856]
MLQPDRATRAEWTKTVTAFVDEFIEGLEGAPASASGTALLPPPPAETPGELADLLAQFADAASQGVETAGPRYLAYFPAGGLYSSVLAEFLAQATNRYTGVAATAPALVAMEHSVIRWLCDEFGLPQGSGGIFTTGASLATLSAVHTARQDRLHTHDPNGTIYVTPHTHHCVAKAAHITGFAPERIRVVPTDAHLRMDVDAARALIDQDRAAGLRPFLIIGTAGATSTGIVDPLAEIGMLAHEESLWFHVDGAYGGAFQLTERGRAILHGIDRADSIAWDPHKSLFLPYGTGVLLVRDEAKLRAAHVADGDYLQDLDHGTGVPDYSDLGPELTREFRGLRIWLPLHLHGAKAFRDALDEKHDLADHLRAELAKIENIELLPSDLTVVVFRSADSEQLFKSINDSGRFFLSSTRLGGRFTLRICVLSHRTRREHVDEVIELIRRLSAAPAK